MIYIYSYLRVGKVYNNFLKLFQKISSFFIMAKISLVCYPDIYSYISVRYRYELNLRTLKNVCIIEIYLSSRSIFHVEFLYTFPINHLSIDKKDCYIIYLRIWLLNCIYLDK